MIIAEIQYHDVLHIAKNMREWDAKEIYANRFDESPDGVAALASECVYGKTLGLDEPIAFVGARPMWPQVWEVWMFATPRVVEIGLPMTKWVLRTFNKGIAIAGAHRVECKSMEGHVEAQRWLEALGAEREAEHPFYGKGGETFYTYACTLNSPKYPRFYGSEGGISCV